ncbi:TIGR03826 family flagellar region protein [Halalkalibacillus halophilus]|uniref:TIGR03826 family flagellar region protein n=1 Tax=Halalkalibacillus halophilus TaxID=392827 RepID=UPI000421EE97|nr:TIGR03826 family flagellar region protein [Halalkalibacillus halophilus]
MGDLANCPSCGQLFVKSTQPICRECYQKEEEQFESVYEFVRRKKNRASTMGEVSEATGVDKPLIQKWLREKRLHAASFPNLTYDCERCGEQIYEGKLCSTCATSLQKDLSEAPEKDRTFAEKQEEERKAKVYFNVDQENKWRN